MARDLEKSVFSGIGVFSHDRVARLYEGGKVPGVDELLGVYPIALELGPSGNCNSGCSWCNHKAGGAFPNTRGVMDFEIYQRLVDEVTSYEDPNQRSKGMILAASGEPTTHREFPEFMRYGAESGLGMAVITNGTAMAYGNGRGDSIKESMATYGVWTRISLNAGTKETRNAIHEAGEEDFGRVLEQVKTLADMRDDSRILEERMRVLGEDGARLHLGIQMVVEPKNVGEIAQFVEAVKGAGADYAQLTPLIYNPKDDLPQLDPSFWDPVVEGSRAAAEEHGSEEFKVFYKEGKLRRLQELTESGEMGFETCWAMFAPVIEKDGSVYYCSQTRGADKFLLGSLADQTFQEIWEGERRREVWESMKKEEDCQILCRNEPVIGAFQRAYEAEGLTPEVQEAVEDLRKSNPKPLDFV